MTMKRLMIAVAAVLGLAASAHAESSWPEQPVTIVVPYTAGGGTDSVARLLAEKLTERWKQTVLVTNRDGASGTIGAAFVARSKPDGYTIMLSAPSEVAISQYLMPKMTYSPEKDLQPVTLAVTLPFLLVSHPSKPYKTVAELIAHAQQNPGTVSYASSGNGTPQHLAAALFEQLSGTKMLHVPYKGVAPSISALLGDQIDIGFVGLPVGYAHMQAGKLQPFGVSSRSRAPAIPDVPSISETPAVKDFDLTQWFGIFVPAGTPATIVARIQRDIAAALDLPDLRATLEKQGAQPSGMPTADFEQFLRQERQKFERIIRAAGLQG